MQGLNSGLGFRAYGRLPASTPLRAPCYDVLTKVLNTKLIQVQVSRVFETQGLGLALPGDEESALTCFLYRLPLKGTWRIMGLSK